LKHEETQDLNDQRRYVPHAMPKRDPATERTLAKVLGRVIDDESTIKTELPNDVRHEIGQVLEQNRELKAQLPQVIERMNRIETTLATLTALLEKGKPVEAPAAPPPPTPKRGRKPINDDAGQQDVPDPEN
jgi:small-conductance mechanosensitive channel